MHALTATLGRLTNISVSAREPTSKARSSSRSTRRSCCGGSSRAGALEGEPLVFSGVTDCYQPLEAVYSLTRRCLEVCRDFRQSVGIVTKGALVRRDIDLLSALARESDARVFLSIPFANDATARLLEPNVALPSQRLETLSILSAAGIPTGIALAPIIPGINDSDIPQLLERGRSAGASRAFMTLLRLPAEVLPVFEERLAAAFPDREKKVWSAIAPDARGKEKREPFRRAHGGSRSALEGGRGSFRNGETATRFP